ncbi:hypothetical protein SAMN02982929_05256 [Saccharopolyspora kobensis]|uniref:Uncharacterized protein n=1 Tax=Saccharopolyspora kobensis TaxID=146035 RepID=A0A1H6DYY4_9PSEU|nr:hypothetical protein [Saccharopolyspora kobensis]SEG90560.1 hypothetical protein SAMN02982929_05256 [Saccharopolyspora kobensis]SFD92081.1 hypothetical protein SAMN05216506_107231 [Saccharopolyspora kobensis]
MASDARLAAQAVDALRTLGGVGTASELATQARAAQWALDDAAFELGGGRYSVEQRNQLAEQLDKLASALRADSGEPFIVDAAD